ncbi:MAG TPA: DUF3344 domain-containing protein [Methanosarcinaceae archaeon]|nr:DUF3344 domain-containing protein [Methanosarcinaceae archaeon]
MKINMKTVILGALVMAAVLVLIVPASANYNWHGFPLDSTTANGSINGTINGSGGVYMDYVAGGSTTVDGSFTVPSGTNVKWAHLYFGIWGGTPCEIGWHNLTFNGNTYPTGFIGNNDTFECDPNSAGAKDDHDYNWGGTCGKWWVSYNVTDDVTLGANNAVSASTGGPLWCNPIDGRIYGVVLVVVYDDTSQSEDYEYRYWIKSGNDAFCDEYDPDCIDGGTLSSHDNSTTYYNGTANACNVTGADLTQVFMTAESGVGYDLEFNGNDLDNSVLTGGGFYFDFDTWDVTNYVEPSGNNFYFDRGTDDYVSLTLSALVLNVSDSGGGQPDLTVTNITANPKYSNVVNTVTATVANVDSTNKSCAFNVTLYVNSSVKGTETVAMLNPDTDTTVNFEWIPASNGDYNITVKADQCDCITETNESNNSKTEIVTITESPQPDLTVTAIYNDTLYNDGFTNTIVATIWNCNTSGWAGTFNVTFHNGTNLENETIKVLKPNEKVNVTYYWTPSSGGDYTLNVTADLDDDVNETSETNNSKTKSVYVNPNKPPDLIVTLVDVPDDVYVNESNTINATIKNNGSSDITWSFNTTLSVNLVGEDGSIVDYETVSSLNAGATTNVSYNWTPTAGGTYRLKVVADSGDVVFESDEANNHKYNWSTVIEAFYDFSTGAGTNKWAYEGQVSDKPPTTNGVPSGAIDAYSNISADDGTYETCVTTTNDNFAAQRFNISINESAPAKINVTWNGKGWHDAGGTFDGAYLYIYNFTSESYGNALASTDSGAEATLTGEVTSDTSSYINSGNVTILVEQKSAQSGRGINVKYSHIETDYVRVVVTL